MDKMDEELDVWTETLESDAASHVPLIREMIANHGGEIFWMYHKEGFVVFECGTDEMIGAVCYVVGSSCPYPKRAKDELVISALFIHDQYRRKGLGKYLVHLCEERARKKRLNTSVQPANDDRVRTFWKNMGYMSYDLEFETYHLHKQLL